MLGVIWLRRFSLLLQLTIEYYLFRGQLTVYASQACFLASSRFRAGYAIRTFYLQLCPSSDIWETELKSLKHFCTSQVLSTMHATTVL